jgi:hypothetical protein
MNPSISSLASIRKYDRSDSIRCCGIARRAIRRSCVLAELTSADVNEEAGRVLGFSGSRARQLIAEARQH